MKTPTRGSVAMPTASTAYLDAETTRRLQTFRRSLTAQQASATPSKPRRSGAGPQTAAQGPVQGVSALMSAAERRMYRTAQQIKARYEDGQPLAEPERAFMLGLLRQHPRSSQKIGCGVRDIVVGRYIGGDRCFFLIRTDGSVEDFSVPRCLGIKNPRNTWAARAMAAFRYEAVYRLYQLRTRSAAAR